jgi:glutamate dehydrogenase
VSPLDEGIVDYYGREEILYLGPDEHIKTSTIDEIADYSEQVGYRPGKAFMTSKSTLGINHKLYGVTSWGVTVCLDKVLERLGYSKDSSFTVKMTGGPDGDVAGNQIINLRRYYPGRARLIALLDGSGLIFDPEGVDLIACEKLFGEEKGIAAFPPEKLHQDGFLLERGTFRYRWMDSGKVVQAKKSEKEASALFTSFIHKQPADIFIPAGGRPGALNEHHIGDFFSHNIPTACAIIEGANLYCTEKARGILEDKGVVIIKDSTANKGGVICSSWEVIAGLVLNEEEFIASKEELVTEILDRIRANVSEDVEALWRLHDATGKNFSTCSDEISSRILREAAALLKREEKQPWSKEDEKLFLDYMLPIFRTKFSDRLLSHIPENHRRAIVAKQKAAHLVYHLAESTVAR